MSRFYAEASGKISDGVWSRWERISGDYATAKQAKAKCASYVRGGARSAMVLFRIVETDERGTILYESAPPHGRRMRWTETQWK